MIVILFAAPSARFLSAGTHFIRPVLILILGWVFLLSFSLVRLSAYPPSPYQTLYGLVRDEVGNTLQVDGAQILLLRGSEEIGRASITNALRPDWNYELPIRIDQNRAATRTYSRQALPALGLYSLAVEFNGQRFYPIEVAGELRVGQGGERVKLDLNLGADTDGDGLPDAWEQWQLYQLGESPGTPGWNLARVTRTGDLDGDGLDNFTEYVAGTFAGDATERFELKLLSIAGGTSTFEFFAITGKVYKIEATTELTTGVAAWTEVPFSITPGGTPATYHRATDVAVLRAYVDDAATPKRFYRLTVR